MNMVFENLSKSIEKIGNDMVRCDKDCCGIRLEYENGIIPHCLVLDERESDLNSKGCAVIGLNPGPENDNERVYYKENGLSYQSTVDYCWKSYGVSKKGHYGMLRTLVRDIGINGPILWSDVVKCQKWKKDNIPTDTIRYCSARFLKQELALLPSEWLLIAVGKEAFNLLIFHCLERKVMGVPNPGGSHGLFRWLFDNNKLRDKYKNEINDFMEKSSKGSYWIKGVKP